MKTMSAILSLLLLSSTAFAKDGKPDAVCTNDGGVEVTIEKLEYDETGALFLGEITKNGRLIRRSTMRRAFLSNGFSLYALNRHGNQSWSFNVSSSRSAYISDQTDYSSIARELGYGNLDVTCDRNLPLVYWRK